MKAILIDPSAPTPLIREVDYRGDEAHLHELLGCMTTQHHLFEDNFAVEEILVYYSNLPSSSGRFRLYDAGGSIEIDGKALVTSADTRLTVAGFAINVKWLDPPLGRAG